MVNLRVLDVSIGQMETCTLDNGCRVLSMVLGFGRVLKVMNILVSGKRAQQMDMESING